MKLWDPPKTLRGLKKRGQLYLLALNVIITTFNFVYMTQRLDRGDEQLVLLCRTINFTDTVCASTSPQ